MIKSISFIGSGNVATQFAVAFKSVDIQINNIFSRNKITGKRLAQKVHATYIDNINHLQECDLIIICINDDNINNIIHALPNTLTVHTSGCTALDVFENKDNYGVIYPIQTLTKKPKVNFKKVPICIEANNKKNESELTYLSSKISNSIHIMDSQKRKLLHLAAVISCNFSNYCHLIAHNILEKHNIDFELLAPLIKHTTEKNIKGKPYTNQTGPARRGDLKTIKYHLELLKNKEYKKIYKLLSESILKEYEK